MSTEPAYASPMQSTGSLPRSIRNNNPGNIRISANAWRGKIPKEQNTDGAFEQFENMLYGFRALMKNLITYKTKYGIDTLRKVTHRWAPYGDGANNPDRYAETLGKWMGISADQKIDLQYKPTLIELAAGIAKVEAGAGYDHLIGKPIAEEAYSLI